MKLDILFKSSDKFELKGQKAFLIPKNNFSTIFIYQWLIVHDKPPGSLFFYLWLLLLHLYEQSLSFFKASLKRNLAPIISVKNNFN